MTKRFFESLANDGFSFLRRARTGLLMMVSLGSAMTASSDDDVSVSPDTKLIKQLKEIYRSDAGEYTIYRDFELREKLELRDEPVYIWTNVLRQQSGSVFVWTWQGRPEAIGSVFSNPEPNGKRIFVHEFHSLSTSTLVPQRTSTNRWQPKSGVKRNPIPGAPKPADSARQRLVQMRDLSKEFTARSNDLEKRAWELRLLTQPLFRYQSTDPEILDGALFAMVTSAGTDPEVVIILEASRKDEDSTWNYAICRFSDNSLYVNHQEKEVWSATRGPNDTWDHDAKHLYRVYLDRTVNDIASDPNAR